MQHDAPRDQRSASSTVTCDCSRPSQNPCHASWPDYRRSPPDLVAAALGPTAEAAEIVAKRGVKAARVRAILAEIARRFGDPDFDLDNVARTLGLSRRYVQQLRQETGKSFTEHLVERRLEHPSGMFTLQGLPFRLR